MDSIQALRSRVQILAPIVAGFRQALEKLPLSEQEASVITQLMETYGAEYEQARKKLKRIGKESRPQRPTRLKRTKAKSIDQVKLTYQKEKDLKIKETHRVSGFDRQRISIVQGGAPGLGKNS